MFWQQIDGRKCRSCGVDDGSHSHDRYMDQYRQWSIYQLDCQLPDVVLGDVDANDPYISLTVSYLTASCREMWTPMIHISAWLSATWRRPAGRCGRQWSMYQLDCQLPDGVLGDVDANDPYISLTVSYLTSSCREMWTPMIRISAWLSATWRRPGRCGRRWSIYQLDCQLPDAVLGDVDTNSSEIKLQRCYDAGNELYKLCSHCWLLYQRRHLLTYYYFPSFFFFLQYCFFNV